MCVNASIVQHHKIVHKGDVITYGLAPNINRGGGNYPAIYINRSLMWTMSEQATFCWKGGWVEDNVIPDLRNSGFVDANGVFIKTGDYSKTYKWSSGFFSQNDHTTTFSFSVL